MQIQRYLEHFPAERLLVVTSESLRETRADVLAKIFAFLGVDPAPSIRDGGTEYNRTKDLRVPTETARRLGNGRLVQLGRRILPPAARRLVWRLASRRPSSTGTLPALRPQTRAAVVDALRPDLRWLRGYLGPSFQAWGLLDDE
jgi:hypothetical protein